MSKFPFRNLVFQGGGSKAFAYHGALRALESAGALAQIQRVAGTSAGAMLATLVSMRLTVDEIVAIYQTFDYDRFPTDKSRKTDDSTLPVAFIERGLGGIQDRVTAVNRVFTRFGLYNSDYAYQWLNETLDNHCPERPRPTFADFSELGYRNLYVVVTNVSTRTTEIFAAETTPDVAVADALLMSQSIPLLFEALQFDGQQFGEGDHYADGGILLNYPLHLFDTAHYVFSSRRYVNGINWETLGCRLYTPDDCPQSSGPVKNIWNYTQHVVEALMEAQIVAYEHSHFDWQRTINISDYCVRTTDFAVRPLPHDKTYQQLVAAGHSTAQKFLDDYGPPLLRPIVYELTDWLRRRRSKRN